MSTTDGAAAPAALALYYYDGCPYCEMVLAVIRELGIEVEYRNIMSEPAHRDALVEARGRRTVPVLAITTQDGEVIWMPESRDIAAWLRERHADGRLPTASAARGG